MKISLLDGYLEWCCSFSTYSQCIFISGQKQKQTHEWHRRYLSSFALLRAQFSKYWLKVPTKDDPHFIFTHGFLIIEFTLIVY